MNYVLLALLGLVVGTFGTLVGAGGGFILTPVLLVVYPSLTPAQITSISLLVVFFNALSGSIAYARMKRIDYRSGLRLRRGSRARSSALTGPTIRKFLGVALLGLAVRLLISAVVP